MPWHWDAVGIVPWCWNAVGILLWHTSWHRAGALVPSSACLPRAASSWGHGIVSPLLSPTDLLSHMGCVSWRVQVWVPVPQLKAAMPQVCGLGWELVLGRVLRCHLPTGPSRGHPSICLDVKWMEN